MCLGDEQDIIDEALYYFKANVFFKSFEVKVRFVELYHCGDITLDDLFSQ